MNKERNYWFTFYKYTKRWEIEILIINIEIFRDILTNYEVNELQTICAQFINIIHAKEPDYTLIEKIDDNSRHHFRPEEKEIVYQFERTFTKIGHLFYPCIGLKNQDFSDIFKIASANDKIVILFQKKTINGYAPIAAIELKKLFKFKETIAEVINKLKNVLDTTIINYEQAFDIWSILKNS